MLAAVKGHEGVAAGSGDESNNGHLWEICYHPVDGYHFPISIKKDIIIFFVK